MSEYPKYFNEISPESITTNDEIHSGLKWTIEYNSAIGQVNLDNYSKYTAIYTDNRPSYYAVLSDDNNNQYARIPVYSYTYTETISMKGRNNPSNYNVFFPILHDEKYYSSATESQNSLYLTTAENMEIVPYHQALSNKNYITTYSFTTYQYTLIKNYKKQGQREYQYKPYNHYPNPYDPYYDIQNALHYFMWPSEYQINNDSNLSQINGININNDVISIGVTYTYLKNGEIYESQSTNNQIVYLWSAKPSKSSYVYSLNNYSLNSGANQTNDISIVNRINVNNNYSIDASCRQINLSADNKLNIETHDTIKTNGSLQLLRDSLTDIYGDDRPIENNNGPRMTFNPEGCGSTFFNHCIGNSEYDPYNFVSYCGYRGFVQYNIEKFGFLNTQMINNAILENDKCCYPYKLQEEIFRSPQNSAFYKPFVNAKYRNNGIGVVLRSYCFVTPNNYKNKNGYDLSINSGAQSLNENNNMLIYPGKYYDTSKFTYHDTLIAAPFNVYKDYVKYLTNKYYVTLPFIVKVNFKSNIHYTDGRGYKFKNNKAGEIYVNYKPDTQDNYAVTRINPDDNEKGYARFWFYEAGVANSLSNNIIVTNYDDGCDTVTSGFITFPSTGTGENLHSLSGFFSGLKFYIRFYEDIVYPVNSSGAQISGLTAKVTMSNLKMKLYNSFGGVPKINKMLKPGSHSEYYNVITNDNNNNHYYETSINLHNPNGSGFYSTNDQEITSSILPHYII